MYTFSVKTAILVYKVAECNKCFLKSGGKMYTSSNLGVVTFILSYIFIMYTHPIPHLIELHSVISVKTDINVN